MGTSTAYPTPRSRGVQWADASGTALRRPDETTLQFGPQLSNRYALRRSLSKIARAYSAQATIGVLGHSVVVGAYSNDVVANDDAVWNNSGWAAVLRKRMASQFGVASVRGLLHPADSFSTNFTVGGGAALAGPNISVGLCGYRVDLAAAANTVTVTGTGRYLRVWGFATTSGLKARFNIDGAGLTTDPGAGSAGVTPLGVYWYTFDIDCTTDAAHSVLLQGAAAGSWYLYACAFISQTASGVVVHRLGKSGAVLPDLLAESLDGTDTTGPTWRTSLTSSGKLQQAQSITTRLGIDLMMVMVDANDLTGGWTTYTYSLADVRRHAQNTVTSLVAQGCDVLFVTGLWRDPTSYGSGVPFTHADAIAQYASVAAANDRCAHLDLTSAWADYAAANSIGLMQDVVHPTSLGHAWMADAVARAIR